MGASHSSDGHSRRSRRFRQQQGGAGDDRYARPTPAYWPPSTSRHTHPPAHLEDYLGHFLGRHYSREYSWISDAYESVFKALADAGLQDSNLIVGIDFTESNEQTGLVPFQGRIFHSSVQNLHEQVISIIGETLSDIDEDYFVPCFGFGDESTRDHSVFSFYSNERPCDGFSEALARYRELTPHLNLAGPTSFAPIIEMAMTIVERSGRQYHVLFIIANGQVTRNAQTAPEHLSFQEQNTIDAIVKASRLPLSIVLIGVGDGPWDTMEGFADKIPTRDFDNFRFVNFTEIMSENVEESRKEAEAAFVLSVMMEIPHQYAAIKELGLLGCRPRIALPPPPTATDDSTVRGFHNLPQSRKEAALMKPQQNEAIAKYDSCSDGSESALLCLECGSHRGISSRVTAYDNEICHICWTNPKDQAFGCGHRTCCDCGDVLDFCPICRSPITTRIKLY